MKGRSLGRCSGLCCRRVRRKTSRRGELGFASITGVDVVVQVVRTSWTKRSRGGVEAGRRNAVPVGFPLIHTGAGVHEVTAQEWNGFEPEWLPVRGELATDDVSLKEDGGRLRVQVNDAPYGRLRRHRRPPAVRIGAGEWVRWQINQRFTACCPCGDEWRYQLMTINVAYGVVSDPNLFLGMPTRVVDERALLR